MHSKFPYLSIAVILFTYVRVILSPFTDQLIPSKKVDLGILKEYQELFLKNIDNEPSQFLVITYKKVVETGWRGKPNFEEARRHEQHLQYAVELAFDKYSQPSHVLTAIHVKFLAYEFALNFLNCAIFKGHDFELMENNCEKIAKELFVFSTLGLRQLGKGLDTLLNGDNSNSLTKELTRRIQNMANAITGSSEELFPLFQGKKPPNRLDFPNLREVFSADRDEKFYEQLCSYEDRFISIPDVKRKQIFQAIKFGVPHSTALFLLDAPCLPFSEATDLWAQADVIYSKLFKESSNNDVAIAGAIEHSIITSLISAVKGSEQRANAEELKNLPPLKFALSFNVEEGKILIEPTDNE